MIGYSEASLYLRYELNTPQVECCNWQGYLRRLFAVHARMPVNGETGVSILRPWMKTASGKRLDECSCHDF